MQTTKTLNDVMAGAQQQMVGLTQENFDLEVPQLVRRHGLHRSLSTDGHKHRGLDYAMCEMQSAATRSGARIHVD
jgi:hypothetical protein